jgi:thiol:disulfide interchange protein
MKRLLFWAFIFPVYTVPTIFIAMALNFVDVWGLVLWGSLVTAFGVWFMESKQDVEGRA